MKCPSCGFQYTKVESTAKKQGSDGSDVKRRRRVCQRCKEVFACIELTEKRYEEMASHEREWQQFRRQINRAIGIIQQ